MVTLAHLEAAAAAAPLPAQWACAQACRAKLIDLVSDGEAQPRVASVPPTGLLDAVLRAIKGGRFTVEGDREIANCLLADFNWVVKMAIAQVELNPLNHAVPLRNIVRSPRAPATRHHPYLEMGPQ